MEIDSKESMKLIQNRADAERRLQFALQQEADLIERLQSCRKIREMAEQDVTEAIMLEYGARVQWRPDMWERMVQQALPGNRTTGFL